MRLVSWNVNGIRAALNKGAAESLKDLDADIICLQEVRALPEQFEIDVKGFAQYWNPAVKKGYSGTGILSKVPFKHVKNGMGISELDNEGRVITAETDDFYLVTVYTPNSQRGLARLDYRTQTWDVAFRKYVSALDREKPVIFCGDLNVAHEDIDLANPASNRKNAGFTDEERQSFSALLDAGFVDSFRAFCSDGGHYTWWSNFARARERNIGWRIDYFGVSKKIAHAMQGAGIYSSVHGSDHCPVSVDLK
ncbi:MAG: exodeoxyribonuclease III [Deltaproteobacteria bacterium]|nr:exodeoxyribonuclease III [Deltaproteobacteria bacterium]